MNTGKYRIGLRMGAGLGLIMMLMIALVLLGILSMKNINDKMDAIIKQNNKQIWYANVIKDCVHAIDEAMLTAIQVRSNDWRSLEHVKIMTARATYSDAIEKLDKLEGTTKGKKLIAGLKTAVDTAIGHVTRISGLKQRGKGRDAAAAYLSDARAAMLTLHQLCAELVAYEGEQSNIKHDEAVRTYMAARKVFIIIAVVMVLFAVFAGVALTRSITIPIREGVDIANRLAGGDLSVDIQVKNNDETGQLLAAMRNMVEKLKQTKDLEHQLRQSQKLETVGRLAGGIAHDFNNMLNVMLGNAELIKMTHTADQKIRDRCTSIENAVKKAAGFVKQLLAVSRKQVLDLTVVDLCHVLTDFEKMMRRMIGENIEMIVLKAENPCMIAADVSQINQVLQSRDKRP